MDEEIIYEKLTDIFRDVFDNEDIVLGPETNAEEIEDWDSANHINIIIAVESAFHVRFKSAELEELKNVGEFVSMIQAKLA